MSKVQLHFEDLKGKTLVKVKGKIGDDLMSFITKDGEVYTLYHEEDCCESVSIEDIVGDLKDIIGAPIKMAEEVISNEDPPGVKQENDRESFTWTFYKLATRKGYVTIRWYGESNGYYSESVDFRKE